MPIEVDAGESFEFEIGLRVNVAGKQDLSIDFYLDVDNELVTKTLNYQVHAIEDAPVEDTKDR